MTHGFDKLDELFSASRRKKRAAHDKMAAERKISFVCSPSIPQASEGSLFPAPSFMKPTSMRMQPRQPTYEGPIEDELRPAHDKGRAQSLPVVSNQLHRRRSSTCMAPNTTSKTRSYEPNRPSSFAIEHPRDSQATLRLSSFRFPEDSLFRSPDIPNSSAGERHCEILGDEASVDTPRAEPMQDFKPLDWSPKHISMLFSPLELPSVMGNLEPRKNDDFAESMILMPSPLFSGPTRQPPNSTQRPTPPRTPSPCSKLSVGTSDWEFPTFPKKYSAFKPPTPHLYSPPASDSEEAYPSATKDRSRSLNAADTMSDFTPKRQPESISWQFSVSTDPKRQSPRETWGSRQDDPKLDRREAKNKDTVPRSRFGKTQGVATLSLVTSNIARENTLHEPTISDIYSLSDEDIAETEPSTPAFNPWVAPPPPPKDTATQSTCKTITKVPLRTPYTAINPNSGEMTPPETPTDSQFLASMPIQQPAGAVGAIMAAGIAKKYNFDLVFLVSLWPNGGGSQLDPSIQISSGSPQRAAAPGASIVVHPKSRLTGRYLAAFGLNQVVEPFKVHTKVLLKALCSEGWNEYREPAAAISRGWTCSFDSDYVASGPSDIYSCPRTIKNRGIVFAAYTKRNKTSTIPNEPSPERKELQERLYADVRLLVDTLVEKA